MTTLKRLAMVKGLALVLALCLFYGDISVYGQEDDDFRARFEKAKATYTAGDFNQAVEELERIHRIGSLLGELGGEDRAFLARVHLLLGAAYEKLDDLGAARKNYVLAVGYDERLSIEGLSLDDLHEYRRLILKEDLPPKQPAKQVIQKEIKKTKKRFPWLLAAVLAAAVVVGLIILLESGGKGEEIDPDFDTRELGIEWVSVPAGEFEMGDNFEEGEGIERPVHTVFLDAYSVSRHEVTFAQYDRFCEETGRLLPADLDWGRDQRPVIYVSWEDAVAFCTWVSDKTGKSIHLPTEAQWEKAARGTDQRRYPWGNNPPDCSLVNFAGCHGETQPVGSAPAGASPYGVLDMAGNVAEWCQDYYSPDYYTVSPEENPRGPDSGALRIFRGGAWANQADRLRSAKRYMVDPTERTTYLGFRLVKEN